MIQVRGKGWGMRDVNHLTSQERVKWLRFQRDKPHLSLSRSHTTTQDGSEKFEGKRKKKRASEGGTEREKGRGERGSQEKDFLPLKANTSSRDQNVRIPPSIPLLFSLLFSPLLSGLSPSTSVAEKRKEKISSNNTILREEERITAVRVQGEKKRRDEKARKREEYYYSWRAL